jgi:DNA topoisomerase-1
MARRLHFRGAKAPQASAHEAGLHYSTDRSPGITRRRHGRSFAYYRPDGRRLTNPAELDRIRKLVIPPAWQQVWIAPDPLGHLQATGRDARGRKQYRYHARWRTTRDETKYLRMADFGRALPRIRRRTDTDLRRAGLPREKVLAAVVRLLEKTCIRVGNDEYARSNRSFGLTTMRDGHVRIAGSKVTFLFRGKSGVEHALELDDRRLARIVRQCRDLPGQELFQYRNETGAVVDVGSADVNAYLKSVSGCDFTSKDFRTWAGTVLAATLLGEAAAAESAAAGKKTIVRAVEEVARQLGNTKAVCRKCYIHPAVFDAYLGGRLAKGAGNASRTARAMGSLTRAERVVLELLQKRESRRAG